jgi:thymidylate synthase
MANEGLEILAAAVAFPATTALDPLLERFADRQMIADMQKVFFEDGPNPLGHNYARLLRGPDGRVDLGDVIAHLRANSWTKQAVVTLDHSPNATVPCLNAIQFLVRDAAVQTFYFARGQDAFKKFYADALCLGRMARTVACGLDLAVGQVSGFIGSCHVYHTDVPAIHQMLAQVP